MRALSVTGDVYDTSRISPQTEISFPHEPLIIFCITPRLNHCHNSN